MKLGIYGGSFNPIHIGHLIIAEYVREHCNLDKILFIPLGTASHKNDNLLLDKNKRFDMVKVAIEDNENFLISDIELKKEKTSYTIDTLLELKKMYPNDELYEIIGEDSAVDIELWKDYNKLLELAKFIVLKRPNYNLKKDYKNMELIDNIQIEISSTDIRNRIKNNKSTKYLLSEKVYNYIKENNLYK